MAALLHRAAIIRKSKVKFGSGISGPPATPNCIGMQRRRLTIPKTVAQYRRIAHSLVRFVRNFQGLCASQRPSQN